MEVEERVYGEEMVEENAEASAPASTSLAARMAAVRERAEADTTELWALPGPFSSIIAVELRMLGWKTCARILRRHRRVREEEERILLAAADQLLTATVGFYEIVDGEVSRRVPLPDETWVTLARRGVEGLADDLTARQAFLSLIRPDTLIPVWNQEWHEWMAEQGQEVYEAAAEGFTQTG